MIYGNSPVLSSIRDAEILYRRLLSSSLLFPSSSPLSWSIFLRLRVRGHIIACIVQQSGECSSYHCEISSISSFSAVFKYAVRGWTLPQGPVQSLHKRLRCDVNIILTDACLYSRVKCVLPPFATCQGVLHDEIMLNRTCLAQWMLLCLLL